ncbi:MAG: WecB/TagA/CpsF family glycosyltransferase [Byssovorax sp.]
MSLHQHRRREHARPSPIKLLPRARLADVLRGRAPLVGSRCDPEAPRGLVSPIEARARLGLVYGDPREEEARQLDPKGALGELGVVARSAVAHLLWPEGGARSLPRPYIVSAHVDNVTYREALDFTFAPPEGGAARMIHFVHPHALNLAAFDEDHRGRLARADAILPDGVGLRVAASIVGVALHGNVNGTDLLPLLCRDAADKNVPLALVGAAPGIADRCAERLAESTPGLRIPLVSHGFLTPAESHLFAEKVRDLGRSVVLVGMGSPLQERWAWEHLSTASEASVLTVGGLFDFFSGRIPRAPEAIRELGLEWAYRLAQEPTRLARRYLLGNPLFVLLALKQRGLGPTP